MVSIFIPYAFVICSQNSSLVHLPIKWTENIFPLFPPEQTIDIKKMTLFRTRQNFVNWTIFAKWFKLHLGPIFHLPLCPLSELFPVFDFGEVHWLGNYQIPLACSAASFTRSRARQLGFGRSAWGQFGGLGEIGKGPAVTGPFCFWRKTGRAGRQISRTWVPTSASS